MKPLSLIGAIVGGAIGAVAWGLITKYTNYEVGFVAWGIGLLVGFGALLLGGGGKANGIACAIIAAVAIFAGKMLSVTFVNPDIGFNENLEAVKSNLGPIDALFFGLGVVTAFQVGSRSSRSSDD